MIRLQYFTLAAALALGLRAPRAPSLPAAAGAFHLARRGGRAALVTPAGHALWLRALDHVYLYPPGAPAPGLPPAAIDQRGAAILQALRADGFNALGGDADPELWRRGVPFIQSLHLTRLLEGSQGGAMVDVYAPGFAAQVRELAMDACAPQARDAGLIGYLTDDSLPWDPLDHAGAVLAFYLRLPLQAPGRQRALSYLQDLYAGNIRRLDRRWGLRAKSFPDVQAPRHPSAAADQAINADGARFAQDVLVRYLRVAADAVHAADPRHLFLGVPLPFQPSAPGSPEAAIWTIADVNVIRFRPRQDPVAALTALTPRPVLALWQGCGTPPSPAAVRSPRLIGWIWSPTGDWRQGRCAQAARLWSKLRPPA
jgi:hypothetical protein